MHPVDTNTKITSAFPDLPEYIAIWAPIFWEPILFSSERICSLIAVKGVDGDSISEIVLRDDILKALFPEKHAEANNILSWVKDSLEYNFSTGGDFSDWEPPLSGFYLGEIQTSHNIDLVQTFKSAIPLCASFASKNFIQEHKITKSGELNLDVWRRSIKNAAIISLPRLKDCFDKKFSVVDGARQTSIDFVDNKLACNFSRLNSSQLSRCIKDSKAQILDLVALRDHMYKLRTEEAFELLVWRPKNQADNNQAKNINEALLELTGEGDRLELRVRAFDNPASAAQHICTSEVKFNRA